MRVHPAATPRSRPVAHTATMRSFSPPRVRDVRSSSPPRVQSSSESVVRAVRSSSPLRASVSRSASPPPSSPLRASVARSASPPPSSQPRDQSSSASVVRAVRSSSPPRVQSSPESSIARSASSLPLRAVRSSSPSRTAISGARSVSPPRTSEVSRASSPPTSKDEFRMRHQHYHAPVPVFVSRGETSAATTATTTTTQDVRFLLLQDAHEAVLIANEHLSAVCSKVGPRNVVVCFDIDDTLLRYVDPNDDYGEETECVPSARAMYDFARNLGSNIVFVTARANTPAIAETTRAQLKERGYNSYTALVLRPVTVTPSAHDVGAFKANARAKYLNGRNILGLNVGDQFTDLLGDWSDDAYSRVYSARDGRSHFALTTHGAPDTLHIKLPHVRR